MAGPGGVRGGRGGPDTDGPRLNAYRAFQAHFNQRRFWEAHEVLEEVWRRDRDPFKRGLIQYAAAHVHVARDNRRGFRLLMSRALAHLRPYAPAHDGFDVAALLAHGEDALARTDAAPPGQHLEAVVGYVQVVWRGSGL